LLENPGDKDSLEKLKNISEGNKNNWNYSSFSKYTDEEGIKNFNFL
jgi:hypothetical protein